MKGFRKCFGVLLLCSITLGVSFVGYSDTNAIDYNVNLKFVKSLYSGGYYCGYRDSSQTDLTDLNSTCRIPQMTGTNATTLHRYVDYFQTKNSFDIDKDHFYLLKFLVRSESSTTYPIPFIYQFPASLNLQFEVQNVDVNVVGDGTQSGYDAAAMPQSLVNPQAVSVELYPFQMYEYEILLKPRYSGNSQVQFSKPGSHIFDFVPSSTLVDLPPIYVSFFPSIEEYEFDNSTSDMNEKDNEDRDNLESQSSDTDSASASSSSDAESTGTTLLGAFSAFVTAITSIFMILFCVPLSISTARKVINLFRSFQ